MKKIKKIAALIISSVLLISSLFALTVSAATASVVLGLNKKGNYRVGEAVTVTVKYAASDPVGALDATISFSTGVLKYSSCTGGQATASNGTVRIVDTDFNGTSKNATYTIRFTAVGNGSGNVSASLTGVNVDGAKMTASSAISVTIAQSDNAALSSLSVSGTSLSPAFNANKTSYTATVKYSVEKVKVSANVADAGAIVTGAGDVVLKVGENKVTVTVTSASGKAKKSYTIKIKRMTQEETAEYEKQLRESDPLLVVIGSSDYHILTEASAYTAYPGYKVEEFTRKDKQIPCLKDESGKYTLCYLTADTDAEKKPVLYIKDGEDFKIAPYILSNGKLYIIEKPETQAPDGYKTTEIEINGTTAKVYQFTSDKMLDFFVFYCYSEGKSAFYRYDSAEKTLQRAPDFKTTDIKASTPKKVGAIQKFLNLSLSAKLILCFVILAAICLIVLLVLVIVRVVSKKNLRQLGAEDEDFDIDSLVFPEENEDQSDIPFITGDHDPDDNHPR